MANRLLLSAAFTSVYHFCFGASMKQEASWTCLRILLVVFVVSIVSVVFAQQAAAATYYLSPSGLDSNSGAYSSPWKTFGFALPRLRPGDTLILKDGTYTP